MSPLTRRDITVTLACACRRRVRGLRPIQGEGLSMLSRIRRHQIGAGQPNSQDHSAQHDTCRLLLVLKICRQIDQIKRVSVLFVVIIIRQDSQQSHSTSETPDLRHQMVEPHVEPRPQNATVPL